MSTRYRSRELRPSRPARPWEPGSSARGLATFAEGLGFDVLVRTTPASWHHVPPAGFVRDPEVVGVHGRRLDLGVIFSAYWLDGATAGARLVMRHARWKIETETRERTRTPTKVNASAITGYGADRVVYLGGPFPRQLGVTALRAELSALVDSAGTEREVP